MNFQQVKILKELGYKVIPEINFIKENSFNTPNCYLIYDSKINLFVIGNKKYYYNYFTSIIFYIRINYQN